MDKKNILEIYKNYLYALRIREEFNDKYGDTDELIEIYEKELEDYSIKFVKSKSISQKFHI